MTTWIIIALLSFHLWLLAVIAGALSAIDRSTRGLNSQPMAIKFDPQDFE